jgi:hypothetical protein
LSLGGGRKPRKLRHTSSQNAVEERIKINQPRNQNDKIHHNIDRLFPYARSWRTGGTGEPAEKAGAKVEAGPEAAINP